MYIILICQSYLNKAGQNCYSVVENVEKNATTPLPLHEGHSVIAAFFFLGFYVSVS